MRVFDQNWQVQVLMTENTHKHDSCKYGRFMNDFKHPRKFRGCVYSGGAHKLQKNECLNCERFEKKRDHVDVWLDFFDAYKKKSN